MKNNPDLKRMDDKEFFDFASKNINKEAIAYADDMVGRSQTQSDSWNSTGIYGQNNAAYKRFLADALFTFGRFQNNRKVGIANDLSILYSDFATSDDKNIAQRRLLSAAIEIGVFKIMSPVISMGFAATLAPMFSEMLGYDEELDQMIKQYERSFGSSGADVAKEFKFRMDNYDRDLSKEFTTSLFDGMMPIPLPSAIAEVGFSALNNLGESVGVDPQFNVYSPYARNLFDDTKDGLTEDQIFNNILSFGGLYQMTLKDAADFVNSGVYLSEGKFPPYMAGGKDRYVKSKGAQASEVLSVSTILNYFLQSADINTMNRKLRGVLERKYLRSNPSTQRKIDLLNQKQKDAKPNIKSFRPNGSAEKLLDELRKDKALQESFNK